MSQNLSHAYVCTVANQTLLKQLRARWLGSTLLGP